MSVDLQRLGTDLHLLDPVERGNNRSSRGDLKVRQRVLDKDLDIVSGVQNLEQALLMRLLTPTGALEKLGHPEYGSRLQTLIGELNTENNRNRAKMYVLEALAQEPRISQVLSISVTSSRTGSPTRVDIAAAVQVAESKQVINLVFPFFFQ